ncbi:MULTISPECIES: mycofactocin-coupled SDR family oxidoreductase [Rhodococcus]|nr:MULTISPECIES: mycofactocin-coupled SDR family oxidoreductase [Rhodococcus]MDI9940114.1 mycofactocin-coupled SDR family oxidoreductase [Rhodococcus sp. IEGM 1351]QZS59061.1 mycofactocin-coupled SDR family oxidoreductase [Rhodococcus opacus]RKM74362.1 SDR family mycofactocin-dependent oxidoreductase [Rhodococcus opacus]UNM99078.1 mycofactocin-coupled SDR family oxidoreductase [Rhodococcus opacus]WKN55448.1 mycofactocin-coupled SDR family oxidoreductase [Rhodococcus opacus]
MGLLDGKVAVISGAARGQGRSHAVRLAEEGADIIAFDICADIDTVPYGLGTREDLDETVVLVEKLGRRIIASQTDVRNFDAVTKVVDDGAAELGGLDIVVANAGITSYYRSEELTPHHWQTVIDVNLTGVWNVARAAVPHLIDRGAGAMVLVSSSSAHVGLQNLNHYSAAKAGVVGLMQSMAVELGPHMIRVNTVHPTTVKTGMALNQATFDLFLPGTGLSVGSAQDEEKVADAFKGLNAMPIPWIDPVDISNAIVYLTSDLGRYVTGTQLRVDAGSAAK